MSDLRALARLERGHVEAEQTLADLKDTWEQEDDAIERHRCSVLLAHLTGARDRDELRVKLGGVSLYPVVADGTEDQPEVIEPGEPAPVPPAEQDNDPRPLSPGAKALSDPEG